MLEQYPFYYGLVVSRMVGGVTTNLLSSVFETWVDTEYRKRGFHKADYETIMRDAVIVKNLSAIASGYLSHILAQRVGPVGPFRGAVTCTAIALVVILFAWTENYGGPASGESKSSAGSSFHGCIWQTIQTFKSDTKLLRVGIIQGLSMASLLIFVFLWSPTLQSFARTSQTDSTALDSNGEPAYGLIFGGFMAAGVLGGLISPIFRRAMARWLAPMEAKAISTPAEIDSEDRPLANEFVAALSYFLSATLLLVPCFMSETDPQSFSGALGSFMLYEFLIGLYMPCEGVIRSLYIPSGARASMMVLPHIVVNVVVAFGVVSTKFVP